MRFDSRAVSIFALLLAALATVPGAPRAAELAAIEFGTMRDGCDRAVEQTATMPDGDLLVGGWFEQCGTAVGYGLLRWNGSAWSTLRSGTAYWSGRVDDIAVSGTDTYVLSGSGGAVYGLEAGRGHGVARWDGTAWSPVLTGTAYQSTYFEQVAVAGTDVYLSSRTSLTASNGVSTRVARWTGSTLVALRTLGIGDINGPIHDLEVWNGALYAAGEFSTADGKLVRNIARWTGTEWTPVGAGAENGVNGPVFALEATPDGLLVGGRFAQAGTKSVRSLARWDGSAWQPVGSGLANGVGGEVHAIDTHGTQVFVGGDFTSAGDQTANDLARFDGVAWSAVGSGIGPFGDFAQTVETVTARATGELFVGGYFDQTGDGMEAGRIVRWANPGWRVLDDGAGARVLTGAGHAVAVFGGEVYVAGTITRAGRKYANHIARWNGRAWNTLGDGPSNGVDGVVHAMLVRGPLLYVAGEFTHAGGAPANRVAVWNGSSWSALGDGSQNGTSGPVYALAGTQQRVYAGGSFTTAGGIAAGNVAAWDGNGWSALESAGARGTDGPIHAMTAGPGEAVIVGGRFTRAGAVNTPNVARWGGSALDGWSALGTGVAGAADNRVLSLYAEPGRLLAGGVIAASGQPTLNAVAWNGTSWSEVARSSIPLYLHAFGHCNGLLYAGDYRPDSNGGVLTTVYSNGWLWHRLAMTTPMGSGVRAIARDGGGCWLAGEFTGATGFVAAGIRSNALFYVGPPGLLANGFE